MTTVRGRATKIRLRMIPPRICEMRTGTGTVMFPTATLIIRGTPANRAVADAGAATNARRMRSGAGFGQVSRG